MDRRKDLVRIFYLYGWREFVNGLLEEGFGEYNLSEFMLIMVVFIVLVMIGNFIMEYYVF